jgi:iron complex outermembrane receptor protein
MLVPGEAGYVSTKPNTINNNSVASATYFNLSLNYTLPFFNEGARSVQVFGTLDNIFNRDPPVAPGGNGYPTNPVYFDTYGRTWRVGVRAQL